jgi:hypothetical protein
VRRGHHYVGIREGLRLERLLLRQAAADSLGGQACFVISIGHGFPLLAVAQGVRLVVRAALPYLKLIPALGQQVREWVALGVICEGALNGLGQRLRAPAQAIASRLDNGIISGQQVVDGYLAVRRAGWHVVHYQCYQPTTIRLVVFFGQRSFLIHHPLLLRPAVARDAA